MDPSELHERLLKIYNDPISEGSFGSATRLHQTAKSEGIKVTLAQVKRFLATVPEYGRHHPQRKRFAKRQVVSYGKDWLWEIDLLDAQKYATQNNHVRYLFVTWDTFSKRGNAAPMVHKTGAEAVKALDFIIQQVGATPEHLYSDQGKEFLNAEFQNYLKSKKINHYTSRDDTTGAPGAEHFVKKLKHRIYRYMSSRKNPPYMRYIDKLQDLVVGLNKMKHRITKLAPADVTSAEHHDIIRQRAFPGPCGSGFRRPPKSKYQVGDIVRVQNRFKQFHKGYTSDQFSKETYKIVKVSTTVSPPTYKLAMDNDEGLPLIEGSFYEQQLQLVLPMPEAPPTPPPPTAEVLNIV
jgi:integrase-like protein